MFSICYKFEFMDRKLRIGILGCANIAERLTIKAFQAISNAEVVSIASRNINKAKEWAIKFNIPTAETYEDIVKNPEIDALYIPLPIGLHKEWILKAAKADKHVLSEKSLAPDLNSVKEIIKVCKENNRVLYENFTCDYHPQHQKVIELMSGGEIGKLHVFQSTYGFPLINNGANFRYDKNLGGSALNESGAYQVYTVRKLLKKEPISIYANLSFSNGVDMKGSVIMAFENNFIATFSFNFDAVYQNNYSVWGSTGLIKVGRAYAIAPDFKPIVEIIKNENKQEKITALDLPAHNHFETIFSEFCDLVLSKEIKKEKIEEKYLDILNQAKVLEAIRISSHENRKVQISEIK